MDVDGGPVKRPRVSVIATDPITTDDAVAALRRRSDIQRTGRLNYSGRTIKNVLYGMMSRLRPRNRSHAVAYAMRAVSSEPDDDAIDPGSSPAAIG